MYLSEFLFIFHVCKSLSLKESFFPRQSEHSDHLEFQYPKWKITKQNKKKNLFSNNTTIQHNVVWFSPYRKNAEYEWDACHTVSACDSIWRETRRHSDRTAAGEPADLRIEGIPNSRLSGIAPFCYKNMWEVSTCVFMILFSHFASLLLCPSATVQRRVHSHPVLSGLAVYWSENSGQRVRHRNDQLWAWASG